MGQGIRAMPSENDMQRRMLAGAAHLLEHFADVPVWIVICGRKLYPPQAPSEAMVWSTVYPAGQNLIVTARALGLGATFTTFHLAAEPAFRDVLGIPPEVYLGVSVAVGWPARKHGPVSRKPIEEVLHWERW
jgi:nitroreductase